MDGPASKRHRSRPHHSHPASKSPLPPKRDAAKEAELLASTNPFMPMFLRFREELDEHHDRRERIIKASRDVTALSKKSIFSMQRARELAVPLPGHLEEEVSARLNEITTLLETIAPDLHGINAHRYQRNISGGLQELVEALTFHHYITTGTLILHSAAQEKLPAGIELTAGDYILGVFDFVGELMRLGITMIALGGAGDGNADANRILLDLRRLREELENLDTAGAGYLGRDVEKKMGVMKTCVEKVENAVCGVIIRGSERPKGWVPDLEAPPMLVGGGED